MGGSLKLAAEQKDIQTFRNVFVPRDLMVHCSDFAQFFWSPADFQ